MKAIVCACGRRIEDQDWATGTGLALALRTPGHDPDECSRNIGFQGRLDGRREMAEAAVEHLVERGTLSGVEIAEIRSNLLDMVVSLGAGPQGVQPPERAALLRDLRGRCWP